VSIEKGRSLLKLNTPVSEILVGFLIISAVLSPNVALVICFLCRFFSLDAKWDCKKIIFAFLCIFSDLEYGHAGLTGTNKKKDKHIAQSGWDCHIMFPNTSCFY